MASRRGPDQSVRVAITGTHGATNWANVFWAQLVSAGSISQADLDAWLLAFVNGYKGAFNPVMSTGVNYHQAIATLFTPGGGVLQSTLAVAGSATEAGTDVADLAVCRVVSWLTNVYWRGGKPRTYLPGVVTADVTALNALTAAAITNTQTAGANFRTTVNALTEPSITSTQLGFVSFRSGNADRPTPLFFAFTGAKAHPRLGTQRRRLGKWVV